MSTKIKFAVLWLILFLAVINTICYLGQRQMEEIVPMPSAAAPAQTTAAELVTGLCTFGDCPVIFPTQAPETSTEAVKESLTTSSQVTAKSQLTVQEAEPVSIASAIASAPVATETDAQTEDQANQTRSGRTVTCWVTAYCGCSSCSGSYGNITANGTVCRPNHTVAVDPSVIPYWTQLEIDGIVYTAEDCGSAVNGYEVDIYFENHWETKAWPTGYYDVTIY